MKPEEEDARRHMFRDIPAEPLHAVAWLRAKVDQVDQRTFSIRQQLDASTDPAERAALEYDVMAGLWARGVALERQCELLLELSPDDAPTINPSLEDARAQQQVARQRLWGDPSAQLM